MHGWHYLPLIYSCDPDTLESSSGDLQIPIRIVIPLSLWEYQQVLNQSIIHLNTDVTVPRDMLHRFNQFLGTQTNKWCLILPYILFLPSHTIRIQVRSPFLAWSVIPRFWQHSPPHIRRRTWCCGLVSLLEKSPLSEWDSNLAIN